jgi:hypothetical protein
MFTAFRKGTVDIYGDEITPNPYPLKQKDMWPTYLDYTYYGEGEVENNWDFNKEFRKRKDLKPVDQSNYRFVEATVEISSIDYENAPTFFYHLPHQKDVYISGRLYSLIQEVVNEISVVKPKLIICTGKWSLFFLTGCTSLATNLSKPGEQKLFGGLATFRSSVMQVHECWGVSHECVLVPIYHPVNVFSMPDKMYIMDLDIQKLCYMYEVIKTEGVGYYIRPDKTYILGDTKEKALAYLNELLAVLAVRPTLVSIDIETFFMSTIDCIGFAYEVDRGCCIPFCHKGAASVWSPEDEVDILCKIREVLLHPNCLHLGQNYQYDCQYYYKLWNIDVGPKHDTMVLHHLLHNKMPKNLAFLASLYCETYSYWKDDITASADNPSTRWVYNAKDCCYTLEVFQVIYQMLLDTEDKELKELYEFQMEQLHPELVRTMNRGVRVNKAMKDELYEYFKAMLVQVPEKVNSLLGFEFNNNSTPQKKRLFKEFFGITLKTNRKKGKGDVETCDSKAMLAYMEEYPLLRPFLGVLLEYSAANKFTSTFLGMKLDDDDRARTQYRITGTAFGRLASTTNVWGHGGNFQNLPEKGKVPLYYLLQLLSEEVEDSIEDTLDFVNSIEVNVTDYEEDYV